MTKKSFSIASAWIEVLTTYRITEQIDELGFCDLAAADLRQFKEPRLMCKMDHRARVPDPLSNEGLSVLAITNSVYRIARTYPFLNIDSNRYPKLLPDKFFELPRHLTTLPIDNITNEAMALDVAFASGMINELLGDRATMTIRGRRRTGSIGFSLLDRADNVVDYPIKGVQIEIDGGFEGYDVVSLFEAKMGLSTNIGVRQLLYPHLHFTHQVKTRPCCPIIFVMNRSAGFTSSLFAFVKTVSFLIMITTVCTK